MTPADKIRALLASVLLDREANLASRNFVGAMQLAHQIEAIKKCLKIVEEGDG